MAEILRNKKHVTEPSKLEDMEWGKIALKYTSLNKRKRLFLLVRDLLRRVKEHLKVYPNQRRAEARRD